MPSIGPWTTWFAQVNWWWPPDAWHPNTGNSMLSPSIFSTRTMGAMPYAPMHANFFHTHHGCHAAFQCSRIPVQPALKVAHAIHSTHDVTVHHRHILCHSGDEVHLVHVAPSLGHDWVATLPRETLDLPVPPPHIHATAGLSSAANAPKEWASHIEGTYGKRLSNAQVGQLACPCYIITLQQRWYL